jgi:hypothetical protein
MRTISIYKKETGEYVFDGYITPTDTWRKMEPTSPGAINFRAVGSDRDLFQAPIHFSQILDDEGDPYASLEAFETIMDGFFAGADNSEIVTALTTLNESVNNSGGNTFQNIDVEITRPANTTPYTAGDVVADVSAAFIPILNIAKAAGKGVHIKRVRIQTEDTGFNGKKVSVHIYKEAPDFIADNAPFVISYANSKKRKGQIPIIINDTVGMNDYNPIMVNPTARDIYFILQTIDAVTPSANSTKFTLSFDCILSN